MKIFVFALSLPSSSPPSLPLCCCRSVISSPTSLPSHTFSPSPSRVLIPGASPPAFPPVFPHYKQPEPQHFWSNFQQLLSASLRWMTLWLKPGEAAPLASSSIFISPSHFGGTALSHLFITLPFLSFHAIFRHLSPSAAHFHHAPGYADAILKNAWLSFTLLLCSKASHVVLLCTFGDFRASANDHLETLLIENASFVTRFSVSFMKLMKCWLTLICEKETLLAHFRRQFSTCWNVCSSLPVMEAFCHTEL